MTEPAPVPVPPHAYCDLGGPDHERCEGCVPLTFEQRLAYIAAHGIRHARQTVGDPLEGETTIDWRARSVAWHIVRDRGPTPEPGIVPLIRRPLQQHERELAIMAVLDVTAGEWAEWVKTTGDEQIPVELHTTVIGILTGLQADDADEYQQYLQALTMASDSTVLWLLEQLGRSPFDAGGPQ